MDHAIAVVSVVAMPRARLPRAALLLATLACVPSACSSGESSGPPPVAGCTDPFLGDPSKPMELELVYQGVDEVTHPLEDGGALPMIVPPQGGWVVFVAGLVTNVDPCGATIKGVLRDPSSGSVRVDERTARLVATVDGRGGPADGDISTFSNVATCPNQWAAQALPGNPIELTYSVTDRGGRSAKKTIMVVPECAEPQFANSCKCQCKQDYVLGETCL
ncbi:MAG: hypothetical protein FJ095_09015 [Deltaproteobacteria bacterium]|nr:hypothetical protein [Deltaproteobacteria bacterium]